jgi:hypothetical protein
LKKFISEIEMAFQFAFIVALAAGLAFEACDAAAGKIR